jgi:putative transposase
MIGVLGHNRHGKENDQCANHDSQNRRIAESQIIKVLKEVEGDRQVGEVCHEYGVSDATYYNWKAKYGGMEVADIRRLKDLEEENQRLKRLFADLSLKHEALKDVVEKSFKAGGEMGAGGLRQAISQSLPAKGVRDPESELLCVSLPAQAEPGSASDRGNPEHCRGVAWLGLPETLQDTTASWLSVEPQTSPSRVL